MITPILDSTACVATRTASRRPCAAAGRLTVLAALMAAVPLGATAIASDRNGDPRVSVRRDRGTYYVTATFDTPQSAVIARAVLTDYERIPRFMPGVEKSQVLERGNGHVVVEQEAVARVMMFSKRVHLVLEIQEAPEAIRFRDRCGRSFERYEGAWTISDTGAGVAIRYELTAKPGFDVPEFLLKRILKRDAGAMIARLQDEIARATGASGPAAGSDQTALKEKTMTTRILVPTDF